MPSTETFVAQLMALGVPLWENEPMKNHTSIKIGGPASVFCTPQTIEQLCGVLRTAHQQGLPVFHLGCGSNIVFNDKGYPGVVINAAAALNTMEVQGEYLTAGAGVALNKVCTAAADAGLAGLAFAYGIPGSIGGAIYMNAGAFEGEMCRVLHSVCYLDENLQVVTAPVDELGMAYRTSVFHKKPWCILYATFHLREGESEVIHRQMQALMDYRKQRQPLDLPSAGSAFKRPEGAFAGALIDQCGLRGYRVGGAAISEKHCGFIVNLGDATAQNVLELARHVVETVREKTGFVLEKEIQVVP